MLSDPAVVVNNALVSEVWALEKTFFHMPFLGEVGILNCAEVSCSYFNSEPVGAPQGQAHSRIFRNDLKVRTF